MSIGKNCAVIMIILEHLELIMKLLVTLGLRCLELIMYGKAEDWNLMLKRMLKQYQLTQLMIICPSTLSILASTCMTLSLQELHTYTPDILGLKYYTKIHIKF